MSEQDAREQSTGSTPAPADPALDAGVRTDDDGPVDPQEQVEERLQQIEDDQRDHEPRHGGGEDEGADEPAVDEAGADERGADDEAATASGAGDAEADAASGPEGAAAPPTSRASGDDDADDDAGDDPRVESDEERRAREEAFAAEHDPDDHDVAAGEEFRQAGDWTAETGKLTEDDVTSGEDSSEDGSGTEAQGSAQHDDTPHDGTQHEDTQHGEQERGVDGRRVSSVEEIRDGGYGVGSAAPLDDGAVPLDHTVKAWEDTRTYLVPGEEGYDGANPHVWFLDDRSAERAGFDHAG
ncbi:hypothetical protein L6241_07535 [Janibacter sp. Y6]|uniref:sunset domain-containing protein n=1 Tax=Janibacter sp. Y6 TaxID=2913552 RepID=UPI0034A3EBC4